jgi:holo-[acyl-carrier protein] synthase
MIVATGVDIVEVERVRRLIDRNGDRFLLRWFDAREIAYCQGKACPHLHFAARLAAKEAAFKALRLSGTAPLCWKDIVVERDENNVPRLALSGEPRAAAELLSLTNISLSIAHCGAYAIAMVAAERSD